jgi:putative toxin-antitoxin system antitoxin component (TIGR02293 family)
MPQAAPKSEASRIAQFMGLSKWQEMNDLDLVHKVESGLPVSAVRRIVHRIDPNESNVSVYDVIPKATYYRILKRKRKPLSRDQSEKVFALSKVFSEVLRQYHDDRESASLFLMRGHPLLGGRSPLNVASESTAGSDLVLKLLDQAEAGVAV